MHYNNAGSGKRIEIIVGFFRINTGWWNIYGRVLVSVKRRAVLTCCKEGKSWKRVYNTPERRVVRRSRGGGRTCEEESDLESTAGV